MIPLIVGAIPFGIIFGTLAITNGLSVGATLAMSAFVFAGSSQFIAAGLVAVKTGWLLIVLTAYNKCHKFTTFVVRGELIALCEKAPTTLESALGVLAHR
ncbi:MAG: AzlC family ABC transporter permease [Cyanobacteria bacterium P01_F01_bin.53]